MVLGSALPSSSLLRGSETLVSNFLSPPAADSPFTQFRTSLRVFRDPGQVTTSCESSPGSHVTSCELPL